MTEHKFQGADGGKVLSYREHFRERWPRAHDRPGTVVEDVDAFLRKFSTSNPRGCFVLLEFKSGTAKSSPGQQRAYEQLDRLLRSADPDGVEYRGAFFVRYGENAEGDFVPKWARPFNGRQVTTFDDLDQFDAFFADLVDPDSVERKQVTA